MERFSDDNTSGYDADDLKALNAAWQSLPCVALDEDDDVGAKSMLDHISERLLFEYDAGKRGDDLVAWYYNEEG